MDKKMNYIAPDAELTVAIDASVGVIAMSQTHGQGAGGGEVDPDDPW